MLGCFSSALLPYKLRRTADTALAIRLPFEPGSQAIPEGSLARIRSMSDSEYAALASIFSMFVRHKKSAIWWDRLTRQISCIYGQAEPEAINYDSDELARHYQRVLAIADMYEHIAWAAIAGNAAGESEVADVTKQSLARLSRMQHITLAQWLYSKRHYSLPTGRSVQWWEDAIHVAVAKPGKTSDPNSHDWANMMYIACQ